MAQRLGAASVLALVLAAAPAFAQPAAPLAAPTARDGEAGRPLVRNYSPNQVGGGGQNWAIVQDARGVLYVGSGPGVLEYDGSTWRLIELPNHSTVRSLAVDASGRVFVGGVEDLGYLEADSTGRARFVSLSNKIPAGSPGRHDVWRTFATPDGVYFQTESALYRWAGGTMRAWPARDHFNRASYVNGRLLIPQPKLGLTEFTGEAFRPLPGTERIGDEPYPVVLPYDDHRLLIGTREHGLFLYDGAALAPFHTDVDDFLKTASLYRGATLPDGTFLLISTSEGARVIDRDGRQRLILDHDGGLATDIVYYGFVDREGALWLALGRGLSRVEMPPAASWYDDTLGYTDAAADLIRHDGTVYLATGRGVSYLRPHVGGSRWSGFTPVLQLRDQSWSFASIDDAASGQAGDLLVATSDGVYRIAGTTATPVQAGIRAAVLLRSKHDPSRVWVGLFDGLASLRLAGARWVYEGRVDGVPDEVRTLVETADGTLWAGTSTTGVLRLRFDGPVPPGSARPSSMHVDRFGAANGLGTGGVAVTSVGGEPLFGTGPDPIRTLRFDARQQRFVDAVPFEDIGTSRFMPSFGVVEGPDGSVYENLGRETALLRRQADGTYAVVSRRELTEFAGMHGMLALKVEPDGVMWIAMPDRLIRYDSRMRRAAPVAFPTLIRQVTASRDRLLFGGDAAPVAPRLPATSNSIRFDYAATTFGNEASNEYQSRLDGLDTDWSEWTTDARREYTNLGAGEYRFRVRARNVAGQTSPDTTYGFAILPPWYRTWWAYLLALFAVGLIGYGVDRVQRRRLIRRERQRAQVTEAQVRAEAAEALARSEAESKKNVEALSAIGREITASLDFDTIFVKLYEHVNQLADADVFGVGLYHPERRELEYRLAIENGKRYAPYTRDASNPDQFPVWCLEHRAPVFINDVDREWRQYLATYDDQRRVLEDGTLSRQPQSLIYLPLVSKDRALGIITIQSFEKGAYTEHHLRVMQNLAAYTSIALDNADAYRQLNQQEHEIRRLLGEAERARATAEEADAAKSAFLSTVSHELRTPLTSVLGFAKIIKKRLEDRLFPLIQSDDRKVLQTMQQVEENLRVVVSEGERLTKLIDDVLDLAKIEAGKLEWHMESVTLPEVIEHATAATASLFEQKGLALVKDIAPDLPAVTGDRDRLIQVVINLISNAVKFTSAGSVTCRARRAGGEVVVSISDTGMGIAPADQPKVFERFKQVGDTLTDKPKGTGLGLPICREIVEHHGGRIWVESDPGRGSTFSFALPITADQPSPAPVELAALIRQLRDRVVVTAPRTDARQPHILVVDDEANIRELLLQEFTEAGYAVSVAASGREALAQVRRERPDLVVLDVMMPEMSGFDVAAVLKNDPQTVDLPILILSIVQDKERGFRLGVDRYLTKPIDTELLFREVGTLIEQQKSRKRVLVVDEDASTVKTLSEVLRARGYSVSDTRGESLVEAARALQPDIIMLSSLSSPTSDIVQMLRFEKGLENVLMFVYQ